jgi:hypothetical protein
MNWLDHRTAELKPIPGSKEDIMRRKIADETRPRSQGKQTDDKTTQPNQRT